MHRNDFSFTADSQGYKISYKGRQIGGLFLNVPLKGVAGFSKIVNYIDKANHEINQMVEGNIPEQYKQIIKQIDGEENEKGF